MAGDETPLVLVHGFAQTPASWDATIENLPAGVGVIAPELPGHGATALTRGEPSVELARQIVLESIEPPAVVWGYSQGARVAFDLALNAPESVSALIIESGVPGIENAVSRADRRSRDFALSKRIEAGSIEDFVALWEKVPALGEQSKDIIEQQRPDRLRQDPVALAAALRGIGQSAYEPMWERLHEITCPVLLITGERDVIYSRHADKMLGLLPDARKVVIPGAAHGVHVAQPAAAAEAAADFIVTLG
ncbi:MAG: alpha/beta fold hydrolase [Thermoleophilaceae bacterium]|nr:alpha/beta fold hydrolase [Thermoleophilaceae bacterium]